VATAVERKDPAVIECGRVLAHRREPGRLIHIHWIGPDRISVYRVGAAGLKAKGARLSRVRRDRLETDYQSYVPCRWDLHCLAQRTTTVKTGQFGDIDACDEHAAPYRAWEQERDARATSDDFRYADRFYGEPEPDCWCPDLDLYEPPDYCPQHGTAEARGTEFNRAELGLPSPEPNGGLPITPWVTCRAGGKTAYIISTVNGPAPLNSPLSPDVP
jgi:hypothetical protein